MRQRTKTCIALALPVQIALVKGIGAYPQFVETYYSNGLYPVISRGLRILFGWIPFSMGDVMYLTLLVLAVRYIYLRWNTIKKQPLRFARDGVMVLSLAYFAFYSLWGMNYYRQPLSWKLDMAQAYTIDELIVFTEYLAQQTNHYHMEITGDCETPVRVPYAQQTIFTKTGEGYAALENVYPAFAYTTPSLKASLFSTPMAYLGNGGYLNPFSNEAQVNAQLPLLRLLTVSGHEVGHQLGYAVEDATNFIGFLVALYTDDPYFTYAAYHHALGYCLSNLAANRVKKHQEIMAQLHPGVLKNFQEIQTFWKTYENPLNPLSKAIFNMFLKINHQKEGVQSYRAVVGLLVKYHGKYGFRPPAFLNSSRVQNSGG